MEHVCKEEAKKVWKAVAKLMKLRVRKYFGVLPWETLMILMRAATRRNRSQRQRNSRIFSPGYKAYY